MKEIIMAINKTKRAEVYAKFHGKCAYCGSELDINNWQVDHLHPRQNGGTDAMENLMPSCRICNHYKSGLLIENFRKQMSKLHNVLSENYKVRVAEQYGLITVSPFRGKFYFETLAEFKEKLKEKSSGA